MKKTKEVKKVEFNPVTLDGLTAKICEGNIKTGKSIGTWSVLYSDDYFFIPELDMTVKGTCGKNCDVCKKDCYVRKSYRYSNVKLRHAINTLLIRQDFLKVYNQLNDQLTRKRNKFKIVRVDQSGEVETLHQLLIWYMLANDHPETHFYIYSKNYDIIDVFMNMYGVLVPNNFTILVSIWHDVGLECFNRWKHFDYVKAFVYDDNNWQYDFDITTYCKAYNDKGKLNHAITCEHCTKCFNRLQSCKVIGCKAH